MKRVTQVAKITGVFLLAVAFFVPHNVWAAASIDFPSTFAGLSSQDLKITIGNIVKIILGFLGIFTVLLMLWGGFMWMTSMGNEDKISQAKKIISAATVGLVIVFAAYSIATFVVSNLSKAV